MAVKFALARILTALNQNNLVGKKKRKFVPSAMMDELCVVRAHLFLLCGRCILWGLGFYYFPFTVIVRKDSFYQSSTVKSSLSFL